MSDGFCAILTALICLAGGDVEFLLDYAGFLLKVVTLVIALAIVLALLAATKVKGRGKEGQLEIKSLNEFYEQLQEQVQESVLDKAALKQLHKEKSKQEKKEKKQPCEKRRVFVLDFDGDIKASATQSLRHEISAILSQSRAGDEVVLRLESGGGMVHGYGLAASQLVRLRDAGLELTVCVDKVAASGGYMMACIGSKVLSAPFAILGSIGVVAQVPNLHRLLKKNDIDVEVLTAGEHKRTLTILGENTEQGRQKFIEDLQTTHDLFKNFVAEYRPQLDMQAVATGEVWLGSDAKRMQLVDELTTSDEYLAERAKEAKVFKLEYSYRKSMQEKLGLSAAQAADTVLLRWWERLQQRYWS